MNLELLPRLIYLASEHRVRIPTTLTRFIPQGELLSAVSQFGIHGTIAELDITPDQLIALYNRGSQPDRGNEDEFKLLISQVLMSELDARRSEMTTSEFISKFREIDDFLNGRQDGIVDVEEFSLEGEGENVTIPKWRSGFEPFDNILDGFYQGILTVIGKPGNGKTSFLLTLMEEHRRSQVAKSQWFFEMEIPLVLMKWRLKSMRKRTKFTSQDIIRCGPITVPEILDRVERDPDPTRIIYLDGPDVMAGGSGDQRRFAIEEIYRDLVKLKNKCHLVVCTSQARRNDKAIGLESPAEAWQKSWYSDMIIGINKFGRSMGEGGPIQVKASCSKNRFGPEGREVVFNYDYARMLWDLNVAGPGGDQNGEEDW